MEAENQDILAVDPIPFLPNPPAQAPSEASNWRTRIIQQLRFVFSRYGLAINTNRRILEESKMRSHFIVRF
jgi:hypothetical protein